jgi:nucleotidyltransferase/DNA polymerase involved in DNA repair
MKIACLLSPHLPVQVERRHNPSLAETPLVVGGRPWDAGAVLDCCPQAAAAGVGPGMRLSQAEALCPAARFVPAREEACRAAHDALAAAAGRFTPTVETAGLGRLYADVSGLERRFGPDAHLARQMAREAARASGLDVRVGMASGKFVARQAARAARPGHFCVVPPGEERAFLSPLPLSALPADPEMQRRLHLLGVRTLGTLAALPRLAVARQFGPPAGPLHDLARGVDPRPVHADAPPLQLARTRAFDDPLTDRAPLLAHADRMAAELAQTLSHRGYQAEGLRLRLEEESGRAHAAGAPVRPPSADAGRLSRLAGRLLGGLAPAGPVAALSLTVYPLRPCYLGATQLALFAGAPDASPGGGRERLREALRRLRERFGEMVIVVASLLGPPPPRPIHVTTGPDGLPRALVWREALRRVETVYEVWRERRCWWSRPVERDYFRLETADGQVRVVFRDVRADRWLLERRHI